MYDIAGIIMHASTVCATEECSGLTEEELRYLLHGADQTNYGPYSKNNLGIMKRWPRRDKGSYYDDYERDDDGNILFDENVTLRESLLPQDRDGVISAFTDDGSWEEGCYCDTCSAEMIKPYTLDCFLCKEPAATGSFALNLDNDKDIDTRTLPCLSCIETHFLTLLDAIANELEEEIKAEAFDEVKREYYREYKNKAQNTNQLFSYVEHIETHLQTYSHYEANFARAETLQNIHAIAQEILHAWEEEFDVSAERWEEIQERLKNEYGFR